MTVLHNDTDPEFLRGRLSRIDRWADCSRPWQTVRKWKALVFGGSWSPDDYLHGTRYWEAGYIVRKWWTISYRVKRRTLMIWYSVRIWYLKRQVMRKLKL